jgi:hypothetical protein
VIQQLDQIANRDKRGRFDTCWTEHCLHSD